MKNEIKEAYITLALWIALVLYGIGGAPLILYLLEYWARDYIVDTRYVLQLIFLGMLGGILGCIALRSMVRQRGVKKPFQKIRKLLLQYVGTQIGMAIVVGGMSQGLHSFIGLEYEKTIFIIQYVSRSLQIIVQVIFIYLLVQIMLESKQVLKTKKILANIILISLLMEIGIMILEYLLGQNLKTMIIVIIEATKIMSIWTYLCIRFEGGTKNEK